MTTPQFQRKTHRARRVLDAVSHAFPRAWDEFDHFRQQRGAAPDFDWPDWCYMPIAAGLAVAGNTRGAPQSPMAAAIITALGTWRMTQGIYRFDPALAEAVLATPLDGDIPSAHLYRLPEWCVYIETENADLQVAGRPLHGAWVHMEYDIARGGTPELRIVCDCASDPRQPFAADGLTCIPLILTAPDIETALGSLAASARMVARTHGIDLPATTTDHLLQQSGLIGHILSLVLYLCADPDITRRGRAETPARPKPARGSSGWQLHPASGPLEWDVGVRIGAALRDAYAREETGGDAAATGRHVRPHVRRAHWHTIVSGARKRDDGTEIVPADRRRDLRWLPPIAVAVTDVSALPAVIHKVTP